MAYERLKKVIKSPEQPLHRQLPIQANSPEFAHRALAKFPEARKAVIFELDGVGCAFA